ncbi:MAG: glycosyltransferase family 4 protein [Phycisphaerales bacterium]|nr:glycosyltransferase family 4 protein [Phycisphaerales bacterium]
MKGKPLSVALVSREYPPFFGGGIGTYARWIVPALTHAGVRVHVITEAYDKTHARTEVDGLTTVHRVQMGIGRGGWTNAASRFSINAGRKVAQLWRTGQIDVAEFAECEGAGLATMMMRDPSNRIPTIVQLHTPSEQFFALRSLSSRTLDASLATYFQNERLAMRLADAILAPSQFIADRTHEHYGFDVAPTVIPYATGALAAPPVPADEDRGLRVIYAGRIEPRKGVESLIKAWSGVIKRHPSARLFLAGADTSGAPDGGSMRAYLPELLDEQSRGSVKFLGRLSAEALRDQYARAHLSVIPSLWENFPNVCIESMSSARAVLVGDAGGMREMIGTTRAGLTFASGDELELCEKMCALLDEGAGLLAQRGQEARERIEHMCDPARVAGLRIEHFRSVIESCKERRTMNADALRDAWVGLERVVEFGASEIDLPALDVGVRRWVEREGHEEHEEGISC